MLSVVRCCSGMARSGAWGTGLAVRSIAEDGEWDADVGCWESRSWEGGDIWLNAVATGGTVLSLEAAEGSTYTNRESASWKCASVSPCTKLVEFRSVMPWQA